MTCRVCPGPTLPWLVEVEYRHGRRTSTEQGGGFWSLVPVGTAAAVVESSLSCHRHSPPYNGDLGGRLGQPVSDRRLASKAAYEVGSNIITLVIKRK